MNTFFIKSVAVSVMAMSFAAGSSFAQTREIEHDDISGFNALSVRSDFKVTYSQRETYGVKLVVEDAFNEYVDCYVKGKCLYIGLDDKKVPKEVKKNYKAKNAKEPVFQVTVYSPSLDAVTLADACTFTTNDRLDADKFNIDLSGTSCIQHLGVDAKSVNVKAVKKSSIVLMAKSEKVTVNGDGSAEIRVDCNGTKELEANNAGSAVMNINGNFEKTSVVCSNSSQTTMSGSSNDLVVSGKGSSAKIDAGSLKASVAKLSVSGVEVIVDAVNTLELELGKGSNVIYAEDPVIKIVNIQNSSVSRQK